MLNLRDLQSINERKPILIAHRGGVIASDAPENSLEAIRLASQRGYDMVELDIMEAKDHVPVLFHSLRGTGNLYVDCGINQSLGEFTSQELSRITYRLSTQRIARLSEALELCAELELGVMLDIKGKNLSETFLGLIAAMLEENGFKTSALTLNTAPAVKEKLEALVIFPLREEETNRVLHGKAGDLGERYYFGWGSRIDEVLIRRMHECGAFVIAAINFFHYPRHARLPLAGRDMERLLAVGVDGFQLDDEFRELVPGRP
ncbi:MAG: hypothetical protein JSW42_08270 [Chloroflexota bacterium]|nr:MAG: hypothetical protein JSW42_08270 [Chloroflexota bacterium]